MTKATILESNINNKLRPDLVLARIYVKNNWLIKALQNLSLHKVLFQKSPNLSHLQILSFTVYVLLYKEKRLMKSKKWAPKALKKVLVDYDSHTIYRVFIKD